MSPSNRLTPFVAALGVAAATGCADESPTAPASPPEPSKARIESPTFAFDATAEEVGLVQLAAEDLIERVLATLDDTDLRATLDRDARAMASALDAADAAGARASMESLMGTLARVGDAHPELEADLEVVRLTIAAGDEVVVRTDVADDALKRIKVW